MNDWQGTGTAGTGSGANLDEMRRRLRYALRDMRPHHLKWGDDSLDRAIAEAVADFSQAYPLRQKTTLKTTASSRDIDLSTLTDRITVEGVEYPTGDFPQTLVPFKVYGDTLTMQISSVPSADDEDVDVHWGKKHTLDASSSTLPIEHEELILLGAQAYALLQRAEVAPDLAAEGNEKLGIFKLQLQAVKSRRPSMPRPFYVHRW
ncbi:hypothetical protein ACFLXE_05430 [Chloroflexota bacterium]